LKPRKRSRTKAKAQISYAPSRPSIAERAQRVNWQRVDEILDRIPANPPAPEDKP
jgi:hypothetical protein